MNGPVAKALLALVARYIEQHGAELFDKLIAMLLQKINPEAAVSTMGFSAADDPVSAEFGVAVDAILANPPTE